MTPEDTVREALDAVGDSTYSEDWELIGPARAALDALVAERDALAARLAEAERR